MRRYKEESQILRSNELRHWLSYKRTEYTKRKYKPFVNQLLREIKCLFALLAKMISRKIGVAGKFFNTHTMLYICFVIIFLGHLIFS